MNYLIKWEYLGKKTGKTVIKLERSLPLYLLNNQKNYILERLSDAILKEKNEVELKENFK